MKHEFIYWTAVAIAIGGVYLSIDGMVNPHMFEKKENFSSKVTRIFMAVSCIASLILWGIVVYLGFSQLIEWGSCL